MEQAKKIGSSVIGVKEILKFKFPLLSQEGSGDEGAGGWYVLPFKALFYQLCRSTMGSQLLSAITVVYRINIMSLIHSI